MENGHRESKLKKHSDIGLLYRQSQKSCSSMEILKIIGNFPVVQVSYQQLQAVTYNVHQSQEVILHMLLAMKSNNRVIHSQQDLYVVVFLSSISAAATPNSVIDLLGQRVKSPRYIQLWLCRGIREQRLKNYYYQYFDAVTKHTPQTIHINLKSPHSERDLIHRNNQKGCESAKRNFNLRGQYLFSVYHLISLISFLYFLGASDQQFQLHRIILKALSLRLRPLTGP